MARLKLWTLPGNLSIRVFNACNGYMQHWPLPFSVILAFTENYVTNSQKQNQFCSFSCTLLTCPEYCLIGLVVKVSAWRMETMV